MQKFISALRAYLSPFVKRNLSSFGHKFANTFADFAKEFRASNLRVQGRRIIHVRRKEFMHSEGNE